MEKVVKKWLFTTLKIWIFSFSILFGVRTNANDLLEVIEKKTSPLNLYDSNYNEHGYWFQIDEKMTSFGYFNRGKKNGIWICFQNNTSYLIEVRAYSSDTLKALFRCQETAKSRFEFIDSTFVRNKFCSGYFQEEIILNSDMSNPTHINELSNEDFFKVVSNDSHLNLKIEFMEGISFCLEQTRQLNELISFKIKSINGNYMIINFVKEPSNNGEFELSQIYYSNQKKLNGQRFIFNQTTGDLGVVIDYRDGFINGKTTVFDQENGQIISVHFKKGKANNRIAKKDKLVLLKYFNNWRRYYFPKLELENPWSSRYTYWENERFLDGYIGTSANGTIYRKATGLPGYAVR